MMKYMMNAYVRYMWGLTLFVMVSAIHKLDDLKCHIYTSIVSELFITEEINDLKSIEWFSTVCIVNNKSLNTLAYDKRYGNLPLRKLLPPVEI